MREQPSSSCATSTAPKGWPAWRPPAHRVRVADGCLEQAACILGVVGGDHLWGRGTGGGALSLLTMLSSMGASPSWRECDTSLPPGPLPAGAARTQAHHGRRSRLAGGAAWHALQLGLPCTPLAQHPLTPAGPATPARPPPTLPAGASPSGQAPRRTTPQSTASAAPQLPLLRRWRRGTPPGTSPAAGHEGQRQLGSVGGCVGWSAWQGWPAPQAAALTWRLLPCSTSGWPDSASLEPPMLCSRSSCCCPTCPADM